jgi:Tol biopolymer transport system component
MLSGPMRVLRTTSGATARAVAAILALALPSCSTQYPNPFENANQMAPPPTAAKIIFSSNTYATRAGGGLDLFAMEDTGAGVTRLTFCNTADRRCDYLEAIPGADRARQAVRRLLDSNGDGKVTSADGESLRIVDLSRAVEGELVPGNAHVSGADWSPGEEILYYSAAASATDDDLFQITSNGQSNQNLTSTTVQRERRPRFNLSGTALAFERIDAAGRGQIWIATSLGLRTLTPNATAGEALANTPYVVGSEADPVFSPDSKFLLYRQLVATGNGGLGQWSLMTIRTDLANATPAPLVNGGGAYRGAPDWNATGIVFVETVSGSGPQLVFVDATGGARRVLMTAGAGFDIGFPHWLK